MRLSPSQQHGSYNCDPPEDIILSFGSPGGSTIISTVLGIAVNTIDFDMDLEAAIAAPRLSQRDSGVTLVD